MSVCGCVHVCRECCAVDGVCAGVSSHTRAGAGFSARSFARGQARAASTAPPGASTPQLPGAPCWAALPPWPLDPLKGAGHPPARVFSVLPGEVSALSLSCSVAQTLESSTAFLRRWLVWRPTGERLRAAASWRARPGLVQGLLGSGRRPSPALLGWTSALSRQRGQLWEHLCCSRPLLLALTALGRGWQMGGMSGRDTCHQQNREGPRMGPW